MPPSVRYVISIPRSDSLKADSSIILNIKLNSVGASTQPCLTPFVTGNSLLSSLFPSPAFIPSWNLCIILTIFGGIPIRGRMFHSPGLDAVSNALVRSTKRIYMSVHVMRFEGVALGAMRICKSLMLARNISNSLSPTSYSPEQTGVRQSDF